MRIAGNTILITGGGTGIGFALAEAFVREGNEVIICGRREEKLIEAQGKLPGLHVKVCDVAREEERAALFEWATSSFEGLNVLVNNAGIQRDVDFLKGPPERTPGRDEIRVNLEAPIHLSALFAPHLADKSESAVINVSSGLAFVPLAMVPIYCATKAALHSFSLSLRHQLSGTGVRVFEVIPPLVETELHDYAPEERRRELKGIQPEEVARATLEGMAEEDYEIPIGMAQNLMLGSRNDPEGAFQRLNSHH